MDSYEKKHWKIQVTPKNESSLSDTNVMANTSASIFSHEEYGKRHNSYEKELREMMSIETGNKEQLLKCWAEDSEGELGSLSSDLIQQAKYLCAINVALSTRAAIRGGVPYELAFTLSDSFIQKIDSFTENEIHHLKETIHEMQLAFVDLVIQQKKDNSVKLTELPLVSRAKTYIFSHLHGKLTVKEIADSVGTHPNYLNRIFKQNTGFTIHETILREKINLVMNMLIYSDYSYIEIASYLGFASQSHLGTIFKKQTGMTLREYRSKFKKNGF